jgi:hypothetical protein
MTNVVGIDGKGVDPPPVRQVLPHAVKARIVTLFAQYQGLGAIQKAIESEFGLRIGKSTIAHYDPTAARVRLSRRLLSLFEDARAAYVGDFTRIGIAQQNHRLRLIERLVEKAETAKEFAAAAKLLELAAKEMGGALTNVSKTEAKVVHLSGADARAELAARLSAAIDGGTLTPLPSPSDES